MIAADIITAARSALGVRFRHQGRTMSGMDCAGLVVYVAQSLGLEYADHDGYARQPSGGLLESALDVQPCLERVKGPPQAADVLLMKFDGDPQHLGIYTGSSLIHAWALARKVCEHGFTDPWPGRVVRVYRFKGIES